MIVAQWNCHGECSAWSVLVILCGYGSVVQQYERIGEVEADTGT